MIRQKQHYGTARLSEGSIINWHGTRYIVLRAIHHADQPSRYARIDGTRNLIRVAGNQDSTYAVRRLHGQAMYTMRHIGGYVSSPVRIMPLQ